MESIYIQNIHCNIYSSLDFVQILFRYEECKKEAQTFFLILISSLKYLKKAVEEN